MDNNVIVGQRGSGKTYRLFAAADAVGGVIVSRHPEKSRVKARTLGFINIKDFISYKDFVENHDTEKSYFIDRIETFIEQTFPQVRNFTVNI